MADELDAGQPLLVEPGLEREDDREPIDPARDLAHPAAPPRPHLRADVVEDRHARALGDPRQAQVELREVDQHAEVGLLVAQLRASAR